MKIFITGNLKLCVDLGQLARNCWAAKCSSTSPDYEGVKRMYLFVYNPESMYSLTCNHESSLCDTGIDAVFILWQI